MKTITIDARGGVQVSETLTDAAGNPSQRSWDFDNADEANKQRAEFESDLQRPANAKARAALDAARAASDGA